MVMNDFFEKNLEDIVFENRNTVHEKGFPRFYKNAKRQFLLPSQKRVDIFTWVVVNDVLYARVIEFKRAAIQEAALWQAIRYHHELISATAGYFKDYEIEICLVGTDVHESLNVLLAASVSEHIRLIKYQYSFHGIKFIEEEGKYSQLKDKYLKQQSNLSHESFSRMLRETLTV